MGARSAKRSRFMTVLTRIGAEEADELFVIGPDEMPDGPLPRKNHFGKDLDENVDFFAPPEGLNGVVTGYTTLTKDLEPYAKRTRTLALWIVTAVCLLLSGFLLWYLHLAMAVTLITFIVVIYLFVRREFRFEQYCNYAALDGFGEYNCKNSRDNVTNRSIINFKDVAHFYTNYSKPSPPKDDTSKEMQHKLNEFRAESMGAEKVDTGESIKLPYRRKKYVFKYFDRDGKLLYQKKASDYAFKIWVIDTGFLGNPLITLHSLAENYYTRYLTEKREMLSENGIIEFKQCAGLKKKLGPCISIGPDYFLIKDKQYPFADIAMSFISNGKLMLNFANDHKTLLNRDEYKTVTVDIKNICNKLFFKSLLKTLPINFMAN